MPMKQFITLVIFTVFVAFSAGAQFSRYIIRLKDKAGTPFTFSNPGAYLSPRAIARRIRYNISIDSADLPVTPRYLDSIRLSGSVTILNVSKWLNQVAIQTTDAAALLKIQNLPFVLGTSAIGTRFTGNNAVNKFNEPVSPLPPGSYAQARNITDYYNYGTSQGQVHIHDGEFLHNKGYRGDNMLIAVFDAGFFGYLNNPLFDSIRLRNQVLGTWDFVNNEASVNEDHPHGMQCLSTIAANAPGVFVGTSPQAKFYLYRTEDAATEYPIEEQNWVAAAERADSIGVDMISSSLGYSNFSNPVFDYTWAQRNGNTAISTRGADMAARKGMIVMNSAGNSGGNGNELKYINCPADGDSVVSVSACDINGNLAGFSSWGPNGAGKQKPDITSVGQGTIISSTGGSPASGSGTSFSNPNVAGLIACLWQAFPGFSNMKIIDAVYRSSDKFSAPDFRLGYGIPNFRKAYSILKKEKNLAEFGPDWLKAVPAVFTDTLRVSFIAQTDGNVTIQLLNSSNAVMAVRLVSNVEADEIYELRLDNLEEVLPGNYTVRYSDGTNTRSVPVKKEGINFANVLRNDWIKAYPVPFGNSGFTVLFRAQVSGKATLRLLDSKGSYLEIKTQDIQKDKYYTLGFNKSVGLAAGTYLVEFTDGTNNKTLKVVKQ
jgi:serine protease AprX